MMQSALQVAGFVAVIVGIVMLWGAPVGLVVAGVLAIVVPEVREATNRRIGGSDDD